MPGINVKQSIDNRYIDRKDLRDLLQRLFGTNFTIKASITQVQILS